MNDNSRKLHGVSFGDMCEQQPRAEHFAPAGGAHVAPQNASQPRLDGLQPEIGGEQTMM